MHRLVFFWAFLSICSIITAYSNGHDGGAEENPNPFFSQEDLDYIENRLTSHLINSRFNGQVLVARYGRVIYNKSFGFADFRNSSPVNSRTSFQIASITKPFTATAILLLQQQGKLSIDDFVAKHIREFPYKKVKIRHLLNHTSGLPNYFHFLPQFWKGKRSFPSNEDLLKAFTSRNRSLRFNPGAKFEYSNTGYAFLALIIERVSNQSFAGFIKKNIFEPLEMHDSFVYDPRSKTTPRNRAFGFRRNGKNKVFAKDSELDGIIGAKGIFSTASDLFKWDMAISQNKILTANTWEAAFEHTVLPNDSIVNYGLGWRLQSFAGNRVVHHPGWWAGFRTSLKRFIDDLGTLIILCNDDYSVANLVNELTEIVFFKELEIFNQFEIENGTEEMEIQ